MPLGRVPVGHVPALPGVPGLAQAGPRGNIGGLLPLISPSPAAFAPSQIRHVVFGRADSVTMSPAPVARRFGPAVLAIAAAVVMATVGGWLAVTGRGQRRRTR
jgi:hypothetical protein